MPELDLSELIPQQTLKITVCDIHGQKQVWEIPPFDNETEHFYWQWQNQLMETRKEEQQRAMGILEGEEPPKSSETSGEIWAPLLVNVVKNYSLEAEALVRDFPGMVLARAGGAVMSFFLTGELPGMQRQEEKMMPPIPLKKTPAKGRRSPRKTTN